MILGDLGFDIIKVEEKKFGDPTRRTPPYRNGVSGYFMSANRNKRSIIVDLKQPAGRQVVLDLVKHADAVLENFRPNVMKSLGLDYEQLREVNPRIVLISINGFGSSGPLQNKTSLDLVAQAMSGVMDLTTEDDGEPIKPVIPLADVGGGLFAALGIVKALLEQKKTGRGQHLEVSLMDSMLAMTAHVGEQYLLSRDQTTRPVRWAPNGLFPTADGTIAIAAYTDSSWAALCHALGHGEWLIDPAFTSIESRSLAAKSIRDLMSSALGNQTTAHWLSVFTRTGVPSCEVANMQKVFENEELEDRGMLPTISHPLAGPMRTFGNPIRRLGKSYRAEDLIPPRHGEHTEEVLGSFLKYAPEKIKELMATGVVAGLTSEPTR